MGIRDDQIDVSETALDQALEEGRPEGLGLRRTNAEADDLTPAVGVGGDGDYRRYRDDAAAFADLEVCGIEPEIGPIALERPKQPFKRYPIGYFHIDIAEVRTEEGKLHLFVAVDRTSKFAFAQLHEAANVRTAVAFLEALIEAVPYTIHTVLTDNGLQFCDMPQNRSGPTARYRVHMFDRICREHEIEHRLTKPKHPWTNGQVEWMNRTLKDATVRRYHYQTHRQLKEHSLAFLDAHNFARRLKTLRGLTPYQAICKASADQPRRFRYDPTHLTSGLNN